MHTEGLGFESLWFHMDKREYVVVIEIQEKEESENKGKPFPQPEFFAIGCEEILRDYTKRCFEQNWMVIKVRPL